jgi:hypothetical protein
MFWKMLLNKTTRQATVAENALYRSDNSIPIQFRFENY